MLGGAYLFINRLTGIWYFGTCQRLITQITIKINPHEALGKHKKTKENVKSLPYK